MTRSLARHLRGGVGRRQRVVLRVLAGFGVLVVLLSVTSGAMAGRETVDIRYEHVVDQIPLGVGLAAAHPGPDGTVWVVGTDGRLVRFDPATRSLDRADPVVADAVPTPEGLLVLTADARPRVVRLDADGETELATLPTGTTGELGVLDGTFVVAQPDGRISLFGPDGEVQAEVRDEPLDPGLEPVAAQEVVVRDGELWTVNPHSVLDDRGRAVRRDPATLAPYEEVQVTEVGTSLVWETREGDAEPNTFDLARGVATVWHPAGSPAGSEPDRADPPAWIPLPDELGVVLGANGRHDFHYDRVLLVAEAEDGIWLVADNDAGTVLGVPEAEGGFLVLWRPER